MFVATKTQRLFERPGRRVIASGAKQSFSKTEIASSLTDPRNDTSRLTFQTIVQARFFFVLASGIWFMLATPARAEERTLPTQEEVRRWIATNPETPPLFKEGEVLTRRDLAKLRPFLPPGYVDEFDFAGVEFDVSPSGNYAPHPDYLAATEKFLHQARLAPDGALENYVAGRPFSQEQISHEDPLSGLKAAWNFNHRWKFYGMQVRRYLGALLARGGTAAPLPGYPRDLIQGGGTVERYLTALYHQAYHTHLAQAAKTQYLLPLPGAGEFEYKHYLEFLEPYDLRGTRYLVYRYEDARKQDDAWSFLPRLRKVRRLSVQERDTPLAGTEMTIDDFTGFSGRVLDHRWTFLGKKTLMHVMNSRHPYARFSGPSGWLPNDRWELRPCVAVEQTPLEERSYGGKIFFWDAQTYETVLVLVFDRRGELWKVNHLLHGWSEDPAQEATDRGKRVPRNIGSTVIDLRGQQATVFSATEVTYPEVTNSEISARYDVNVLTEGRR